MRHPLLLVVSFALGSMALAKPAAAYARKPPAVEVVEGDPTVTDHVNAHAAELAKCTPRTRATFVRSRVTLRWNARGDVKSVAVGGPGGAAFARCVSKALRVPLDEAPARGGRGSPVVIIRRTVVRTPVLAPAPVAVSPLQQCTKDDDCVVHFQSDACFPGDPVAVNKSDMTAVRAAFPVRHLDCAMGGQKYMEERMANEGRYSAACEAKQCVVRDAGPRSIRPGL